MAKKPNQLSLFYVHSSLWPRETEKTTCLVASGFFISLGARSCSFHPTTRFPAAYYAPPKDPGSGQDCSHRKDPAKHFSNDWACNQKLKGQSHHQIFGDIEQPDQKQLCPFGTTHDRLKGAI